MRLPLSISAATVALGAQHKNRSNVTTLAAGHAFTLPPARGLGNKFRIVVGVALASGDITVTTSGSDTLKGAALINNIGDSTAATVDAYPTGASDEVFTFDQSAGGGLVGDWVEFEDVKSGVWAVNAMLLGQADPATPFSSL